MKKLILVLSLTIIISGLIVGCGKKDTNTIQSNTKNEEVTNKQQNDMKTATENSSKTISSQGKKVAEVQSRKQEFKDKLDKIQKDLEASEERKKIDDGTTADMIDYAYKEYTEWDKALNEIYSVLKQQLPPDNMKKLQVEELKWIK
jgi:DNA repair exonuclease SbcCD ATPase subunit